MKNVTTRLLLLLALLTISIIIVTRKAWPHPGPDCNLIAIIFSSKHISDLKVCHCESVAVFFICAIATVVGKVTDLVLFDASLHIGRNRTLFKAKYFPWYYILRGGVASCCPTELTYLYLDFHLCSMTKNTAEKPNPYVSRGWVSLGFQMGRGEEKYDLSLRLWL